ncbi:hypothetical protein HPB52_011285 [Rhipicephalus sanguineus]|uniref:Uncharacterized protein n=1 Tax=Rhipicephalus sanguineus TaxID=34632 RepID=A0A9D4Q758_RHISA|nr:hypothetical protein HPB52_011285 [Rhipicephalus sanguineus]
MTKDSRDTAKAIDDLRRELRKELREIKDSLNEVKDLKEGLSQILKENEELKAENAKLRSRVEEVEQYQRSNNLEIKGVPTDIEPFEAVKKIGAIPDAFAGLRNVSLVSIEAPRLKRLPQFAFRGLEHAGELLIRDAEIGLIDSGAFAGLSHARRVTLEGCTVEAVRAAAFAGMRAVGQLRIGGNRLGSVLPGALDALDQASVSHVLLSGNWLPCDCRLRWAPESLRRRGFCSSPAHLLNASAAQVSLDTLPRCLPEHFVPHTRPDAPPLSGRQQTSGAAAQSILAANISAVLLLLLAGGSWLQRLVFSTSCLPECYL